MHVAQGRPGRHDASRESKRARIDGGSAEDEAAPRLLGLLLEVREHLRKMDIGALEERINARMCHMERARTRGRLAGRGRCAGTTSGRHAPASHASL
jgi:hypothetical protein